LMVFYRFVIVPYINTPQFQQVINTLGIWGYLIIILYVVASHVFAPISGSPAVILAFTIYGVDTGLLLAYIAGLISCTINFYLSRKFGREIIKKFAGKDSLEKIDSIPFSDEKKTLIVARVLGFALFDFISYAFGLTNMPFKSYFIITAITGAFINTLLYFVYRNINFRSTEGIAIMYIFLGSALAGFTIILNLYIKKVKKNNTKNI
jgi:uncharacterized membrane protein YdjX (TVP38/TMEM64 family)